MRTTFPIIIAGENFGCGSSREHAPIAIGAAGGKAVVAQSYARIFFRNCSATGELYPWETVTRLVDKFRTVRCAWPYCGACGRPDGGGCAEGARVKRSRPPPDPSPLIDIQGDEATIRFDEQTITNERTMEVIDLKPLGDVMPVVDAGGIFEYARRTGMIAKK